MALVSTQKLLSEAQQGKYAIGAFNFENMEMAQAIISAANATGSPLILQTTPSTVRYGTLPMFAAMIRELAKDCRTEIALHLDHGESFEMAQGAIRAGYNSVMIDGSKLCFDENIALTQRVKAMAGTIPVEAELGAVGGKEDTLDGGAGNYTNPAEAAEFVKRTGIQFLAVAIGTAHGIYQGTPKLDIDRLSQIRERVTIPLVLHGTSGVAEEQVRRCIEAGICKVNYATELRIAYTQGVRDILHNGTVYDPKAYGKAGFSAVQKLVEHHVQMLRG